MRVVTVNSRTRIYPFTLGQAGPTRGLFLLGSQALRQRPRQSRAAESGCYSITSSARVSSIGDIWSPSSFAVLRLMASSMLVGNSIGKAEGLAPFSILSTYNAARWLHHSI